MTLNSSTVAPSPTSSTSPSAGSSTVANASRLRENQRRSRARKKEYLLSLEARFQQCQKTGIEANIEIQIAAKKVVRENLLLRGMLKRHGVTDAEIDKTLKEGGEGGIVEGETVVGGVLKVLGRRSCGGAPTTGGAGTQCKSARAGERGPATERRNSTGMVAARDSDSGGRRGVVTGGAPALTVTTSKLSSPLHSPHQHTPSSYPTPTSTPTTAPTSNNIIPTPATPMNYYSYNMSPSSSQPSYASPAIPSPDYPSYNPYQISPTTTSPSSSCCLQPQNTFYSGTQPQYSPSSIAISSPCCPQRPMYATTVPPPLGCSYQTAPISSTTPCHLAQSFINQLHPGLPGESTSHLVDEICPPGMINGGQCHVDNAVLFGVLDRI